MAPRDNGRGNGRLIVEVVNRGRRRTVAFFNRGATPAIDSDAIPVGDGFLLRHGYSVLSVGWQWDVYRSDALLGLTLLQSKLTANPLPARPASRCAPTPENALAWLANRAHRPYSGGRPCRPQRHAAGA